MLRTTFISGFPGETREEHEEVLAFMREFRIERGGAFAYSEEDGTPAASHGHAVPRSLRLERRDRIIALQQELSTRFARSRVGSTIEVLIDRVDADARVAVGRSAAEAPEIDPVVHVSFASDAERTPRAGDIIVCRVTGSNEFDLEAVQVAVGDPSLH